MIFYNFLYRFYLEGGICLGSGLLLFCLLVFIFSFWHFILDCRFVSSAFMDETFWALYVSFQVYKIL